MQILINNEKIDFTLQSENTLGDVFNEISKWANNSGFFIKSINKDDQIIDPSLYNEFFMLPINKVSTISFNIEPATNLLIEKLYAIHNYFSLLLNAINEKSKNIFLTLEKNYEEIINLTYSFGQNVNLIISHTDVKNIYTSIKDYFTNYFDSENNAEKAKNISSIIQNFLNILIFQIKEILDPKKELLSTSKLLKELLPDFLEVSLLLQTGKDKKALNIVFKFIELSQKILRLMPFLKFSKAFDFSIFKFGGKSFEEFFIDYNTILNELIEAFSANDFVLIGDLFEYEITPRIEIFTKTLDNIEKES